MAEQVVRAVREAILAGTWSPGEPLPTEPELADQFGVSRAVIRDATRMLAAQGLVQAQHGRGVFVTDSQVEAFGDALLLALRRAGASAWDVEHFEQILYPEVFALATAEASEEELAHIQEVAAAAIAIYERVITAYWAERDALPPVAEAEIRAGYEALVQAIFDATQNEVLRLLARPLTRLRNLRRWEGRAQTPAKAVAMEAAYYDRLLDALAGGNPQQARAVISGLMQLPPEAEAAMRQTPVGEISVIIAAPTRGRRDN